MNLKTIHLTTLVDILKRNNILVKIVNDLSELTLHLTINNKTYLYEVNTKVLRLTNNKTKLLILKGPYDLIHRANKGTLL